MGLITDTRGQYVQDVTNSLIITVDRLLPDPTTWVGGGLTWVGGDKIVDVSKILSDYSYTSLSDI